MAEQFLVLMADLDEKSQSIMAEWYKELQDAGFCGVQTPGLPFHISLATFSLDKEEAVKREMKELSERFKAIPVHISHIGLFEGGKVLFGAPDMNPSGLLSLREAIKTEKTEQYPWTPHVTMMIDEPDVINAAIKVWSGSFHSFRGEITRLHLCAFWPTREISTVDLDE